MQSEPLFRGAGTALITPFTNGAVDHVALEALVHLQLDSGIAALVACGTTGEPATLNADEREAVISTVVEAAAGRAPVICGTGSNCTASVIEAERRFRGLGCAAQLVVTPYYNKTTQEGLYAHFMAIAEATELPIIIYNVPSRTGLDIAPRTLERLCESGRFIAIKESSFDIPFVMEKIAAVGDRLVFYSGNDEQTYPLLALGAQGVISVAANVRPAPMVDMVARWFAGDREGALKAQLKLLPLSRALFKEVNPIPIKYAAEIEGICSGELRLPLVRAGEETQEAVRQALM